jgi:phytoene dehydrogenase-like protein
VADFDAVVIGSGPNGLAAGLRLAEAGWSVCVLEALDEIGGAARTVESTLPGFRHDFGAAFFPLVAQSPAIAGRDLARHGLTWLNAPLVSAHPFPNGRALAIGATSEETAAWFDKIDPADADAWRELDATYGDLMALFLHSQMVRWPFADLAGLAAKVGIAGGIEFARVVLSSIETLARRFSSDEARAFMVGPAMHADLPPEAPGTGIYALILTLLGQRNGMPVAAGGTGSITTAMAAALVEAGGVVATGRPVDRIIVRDGRVAAVRAGGDELSVGKAVIATIDPDAVIRRTGAEHFPPGALQQARRYRRGLGTFKVDWALDAQVPWTAEACRQSGVVHVGDSVTQMSKAIWEASHGLLPAKPMLVLGQQSLADPSRAPAGKHTLWGYAHVPAEPTGDAARPRARGEWSRSATAFLDRMEAVIEAHAPGFADVVLARKVWTPPELEAGDPALVGGDIAAGSFAVDQQLIFRPGADWWRWGSPVKGLYLGGASVPPGGGVHGSGGDMAAAQALADATRGRRLLKAGAAVTALVAAGELTAAARNRRR